MTNIGCFFPAYYRGAMGILLVYDITDEGSFNNIRNWMKNIEEHASDNVNKILVGNKSDVADTKRAVPYQVGKALADEYKMQFFETSAKENTNVEEVFSAIARDVIKRLQQEQQGRIVEEAAPLKLTSSIDTSSAKKKSRGCC
ncbi:hypothetical protein CEUSTIGMA_g3422.t1 [Chlamydomonas eustigma]|uniref:Uncharacterized protein n=1 Tax=Chlamydomonas eustigma TaxID=1157962 RepID=A0A250WZ56_9CHLO|nr:hypothetical protein CEUSTIGMA_g3422.t1 [Chlamydomonas eustigma]|eukprot:GAX75979.1 hypothetical protein CEUSTIGMA_g3422.t1 [Chlamydomonas eustigma]